MPGHVTDPPLAEAASHGALPASVSAPASETQLDNALVTVTTVAYSVPHDSPLHAGYGTANPYWYVPGGTQSSW